MLLCVGERVGHGQMEGYRAVGNDQASDQGSVAARATQRGLPEEGAALHLLTFGQYQPARH